MVSKWKPSRLTTVLASAAFSMNTVSAFAQQTIPPSDTVYFRQQGSCNLYQYHGPEAGLSGDFTAFWNAHPVCGTRHFGSISVTQNTQTKQISWRWSDGGSSSAAYQMIPCPDGYALQDGFCVLVGQDPDKRPDKCAQTGNPIYFGSGAKVQEEVDILLTGIFPLSYERIYRSNQKRSGSLGIGWKDNLSDRKIVLLSSNGLETAVVRRHDSYFEYFHKTGDQWVPDTATPARLQRNPDGSWIYRAGDNSAEHYDSNGKLISIVDSSGQSQIYQYDVLQRLVQVSDTFSNSIRLEYNTYGLISKVVGPVQYEVQYEYKDLQLTKVIHPDGTSRTYHYENATFPFALTGISDEEGIRYGTWSYDVSGRATSSQHFGNKDSVSLAYPSSNTVRETNALGKQTAYQLALLNGVRRVVSVQGHASANCAAANRAYEYYPNGTLESKIDWSGNTTTYVRDNFGRETSRTEAFGTPQARNILTEYHPTLNLAIRITEPNKVTIMSYDADGRLLSQKIQSVP